MKMKDLFLFLFGIFAFFCLTDMGAQTALVALMSGFGLPICVVMALAPSLFLFLVVARSSKYFFGKNSGYGGLAIVFLIALAIISITPAAVNKDLEFAGEQLREDDQLAAPPTFKGATLALVGPRAGYWSKKETRCDDFCQRALLNKQVKRILLIDQANLTSPDDDAKGLVFFLERRNGCPAVNLRSGINKIKIKGEQGFQNVRSPVEQLRLRIALGDCLIQQEGRLRDADAAIVETRLGSKNSGFNSGFNLFADTVSAQRLSYFVRENGAMAERYRSTGITMDKMFSLLLPSYNFQGTSIKPGFIRVTSHMGPTHMYPPSPDFSNFVVNVLRLDLAIPSSPPL